MPLGRVDIDWIDNKNVIVSWIKSTETSSNILAKVVHIDDGKGRDFFVEAIPQGRISGYPQVKVIDKRALFAWTENNQKTSVATKWISLNQLR
tara:strand:- start:1015 stop:1293 length:279 start_codon:yes stop_codon:yes gene_type:complete